MKRRSTKTGKALIAAAGVSAALALPAVTHASAQSFSGNPNTATPIKHLVIIFQENVSFDHYYGTYPTAANNDGQPFTASPGTPSVNGLSAPAPGGVTLLTNNPNGVNPNRYDPANINDQLTCDQNHDYTAEQRAFDNGKMDSFVSSVGTGSGTSATGQACHA